MSSRKELRELIYKHLDLEEIRELCFDLGIDYEDFGEGGKRVKILELLKHHGATYEQIVEYLRKERPEINWPDVTEKEIEYPETATLKPREREILLNRVQSGWINGVLKQSLHERVKLELGLEYDFNLQGQVAKRQKVEFDKEIGEIFDDAGRQLLILGEPGSGKTTTLLMLAEDLLNRAKNDPNEPVPLILNLSTWSSLIQASETDNKRWWKFWNSETEQAHQKPFDHWLAEACFRQYSLDPRKTIQLLNQREIVLLLDALDEVGSEKMEECLQAIDDCGLQEFMVSSRIQDYGALETNLHVTTGINILPLADEQIEAYLSQKSAFEPLKTIININDELKELARTPLMLGVMALAFEETGREELEQLQDQEDKVAFIFGRYVDQMFMRRPVNDPSELSQLQTHNSLIYIATLMEKCELLAIELDEIQPNWLPTKKLVTQFKLLYSLCTGLFCSALFFMLIKIDNTFKFVFISIICLLIIIRSFNLSTVPIHFETQIEWKFPDNIFNKLQHLWQIRNFSDLLIFLLLISIVFLMTDDFARAITLILTIFIIFALMHLVRISIIRKTISSAERPNQKLRRTIKNEILLTSLVFMPLSYVFTFVLVLVASLAISDVQAIAEMSVFTASSTVLTKYIGLLLSNFQSLLGPKIGFFVFFVLLVSMGSAFYKGFQMLLKHYLVRIILRRSRLMPYPLWWQNPLLVDFLDSMVSRALLQRSGASWQFVHKSLQGHFVAQSDIIWEEDRMELGRVERFLLRVI